VAGREGEARKLSPRPSGGKLGRKRQLIFARHGGIHTLSAGFGGIPTTPTIGRPRRPVRNDDLRCARSPACACSRARALALALDAIGGAIGRGRRRAATGRAAYGFYAQVIDRASNSSMRAHQKCSSASRWAGLGAAAPNASELLSLGSGVSPERAQLRRQVQGARPLALPKAQQPCSSGMTLAGVGEGPNSGKARLGVQGEPLPTCHASGQPKSKTLHKCALHLRSG